MFGWQVEVLGVAAGLALGSYAVTAAMRFARLEPSSLGRSRCDACGVSLSFARTIPVVSYVGQRGTCAACGDRIDPLHLVGEAAGALIVGSAILLSDPVRAVLVSAIGLALLASSVVDLKVKRLPDGLTVMIAFLGAGLSASHSWLALAVGLGCALASGAVLQGLRFVRGRSGRDPGLGLGDVKMVAAVSLWLGAASPWMLVLAASLGLAAVLIVRPADKRLPFGPAIAVATWVVGLSMELGLWPLAI